MNLELLYFICETVSLQRVISCAALVTRSSLALASFGFLGKRLFVELTALFLKLMHGAVNFFKAAFLVLALLDKVLLDVAGFVLVEVIEGDCLDEATQKTVVLVVVAAVVKLVRAHGETQRLGRFELLATAFILHK